MPEPAKLPGGYVTLIAAAATPETGKFYLSPKSLAVAVDNRVWVNPFAEPQAKQDAPDWPSFERIDGGYRVDLSEAKGGRRFVVTVGDTPEPIKGVPWIPVVEIVTERRVITAEGSTDRAGATEGEAEAKD